MTVLRYVFLFLHKSICCGYSLEAAQRGAFNEYPQQMYLWRKISQNYHQILLLYANPLRQFATNVLTYEASVMQNYKNR